jgi:site-specific recombinase XerD
MAAGGILADYRRHLVRKALAPSTIDRYMTDLRAFERWLGEQPIAYASSTQIEDFLDSRKFDSPRSRYRWLSELHNFFTWAVSTNRVDCDPTIVIIRPRLSRLLPRPVDDEVMRAAMRVAGPQMKAWLTLFGFAGLRCVEVAALDAPSIGPEVMRVRGKGGHERMVPIHPVVREALNATALSRTGPVFRQASGQPYKPHDVSKRVALFHEMIGFPGVTAHQYRHNFGTRIYRHSKDLRATQELLGHQDPGTTAGYAALAAEDLAQAVRNLPEL